MPRWIPDNRVGANEHIGRRLFEEPMLAGSVQPRYDGLDLRNFEETRDREFSLARLGRSSPDNSVLQYLRPRAEALGASLNPVRSFDGWAVLRARQLEGPPVGIDLYGAFPVIASPEVGTGLSENIYHAHIMTPDIHHYSIALHLRQLFAKYGTLVPAPKKRNASQVESRRDRGWRSFWATIKNWTERVFARQD